MASRFGAPRGRRTGNGPVSSWMVRIGLVAAALTAGIAGQSSRLADAPGNGSPVGFGVLNSVAYFSYDDGVNGAELWRTDGTVAGTSLVANLNPGGPSSPHAFTASGGRLFFVADDGATGAELWSTDGVTTALVLDVNPGPLGSSPDWLTDVNGTLFFSAETATQGRELWSSDGTAAGTVLVKDIAPGQLVFFPPFSSNPSWLVNLNGVLYFAADDTVSGFELWKSNGTAAGTVLVKDIYPGAVFGPNSSVPSELTVVSGVLFFRATDGVTGYELYRSLGTAASTLRVADIQPGIASGFPERLRAIGTTLYFTANNGVSGIELWKTAPPFTTATQVLDINPGPTSSTPTQLAVVGGVLYFAADDGAHGVELWTSNGTAGGTTLVLDANPGTANGNPKGIVDVLGCGGAVLALDGGSGSELWRTDGTAAGTSQIHEIAVGPTGAFDTVAPQFALVANRIVFAADDGVTGNEPRTLFAGSVAIGGPRFTQNPLSQSLSSGATLTLSAAAPNAASFQWRKDQVAIPGATSATLVIPSVTPAHAGVYDVVATNACGDAASAAATVTVSGFTLVFDQPLGSRSIRTQNSNGIPGLLYFTAVSADPTNGATPGAGPWFGMFIDFNDLVNQFLIGFPPFVGVLDPAGGSLFVLPGGSLDVSLVGISFWAVSVMADLSAPGGPVIVGATNVASVTIQ